MIDLRHLAIRSAPAHVIAFTAIASYLAQLLGILQEWPLWAIGLATLLPWLPLATREVAWTYRHYGWLALFYVLVITQGGHLLEHATQMVQIHMLDLSSARSRGIFGALDTEWVHWTWNTIVLVAVAALTWRFRSNRWLWAALAVAVWHEIEHVFIMSAFLATGRVGGPGLLSQRGLILGGLPLKRPDLHFLYVTLQTLPLFAAFLVQLKRTHDLWLARALPSADTASLSEVTSKLRSCASARARRSSSPATSRTPSTSSPEANARRSRAARTAPRSCSAAWDRAITSGRSACSRAGRAPRPSAR